MTVTETIKVLSCHHDHALEIRDHGKPYTCDGCKTESSGLRYRCEACNFDLHEECAFTIHEETTCHDFFQESKFRFFRRPPVEYCNKKGSGKCGAAASCEDCQRYCDGCGKAVDGFVYHCEGEGWDLHPRCLELKRTLAVDDVEFGLKDKVKGRCVWCRKRKLADSFSDIRGWSYVSGCGEYHFHVRCAAEMVLEMWRKESGGDGKSRLAVEKVEMGRVVANRRRGGGGGRRGGKLLRVLRVFLRTFACVFFGEPTLTLTCLVAELLLN